MRRSDVPTPALLIDIGILDRNIAVMRDLAAALGLERRPHAKAHKCVEIGQQVMATGAIGISCATIGEAEAMALGGVAGILVTAPLISPDALQRLQRQRARARDDRRIPHLALRSDRRSLRRVPCRARGGGHRHLADQARLLKELKR